MNMSIININKHLNLQVILYLNYRLALLAHQQTFHSSEKQIMKQQKWKR